jgi:hypothetical protein
MLVVCSIYIKSKRNKRCSMFAVVKIHFTLLWTLHYPINRGYVRFSNYQLPRIPKHVHVPRYFIQNIFMNRLPSQFNMPAM